LFVPFTVEPDLIKEAEDTFNQFLETCESLKAHHDNLQCTIKLKRIDEARKEQDGEPDAEEGENES